MTSRIFVNKWTAIAIGLAVLGVIFAVVSIMQVEKAEGRRVAVLDEGWRFEHVFESYPSEEVIVNICGERKISFYDDNFTKIDKASNAKGFYLFCK